MTDMAVKANWSERIRRRPAVVAALAVFAGSAAAILGAWYFQYVLQLPPCPLCLEERVPYHTVIPLSLLLAIAAMVRAPRALIVVGFLAIIAAMLVGAALGAYHAGVEWRWWPGPTDCSGPISDFSAKGSMLDQLRSVHIVRCDEAAWRFLGLSLAGYNVLVSLALAAIAALGLIASPNESAA
jgi:disulfide bond formation protein DsbB